MENINVIKGLFDWQRKVFDKREVELKYHNGKFSHAFINDGEVDIAQTVQSADEIDLKKFIIERQSTSWDSWKPIGADSGWKPTTTEDRLRWLEKQKERRLGIQDETVWRELESHLDSFAKWMSEGDRRVEIHIKTGNFSNRQVVPFYFGIHEVSLDMEMLVNVFESDNRLKEIYEYFINQDYQLEHEIAQEIERIEEIRNEVGHLEAEDYEEIENLANKYKATLEQKFLYFTKSDPKKSAEAKEKWDKIKNDDKSDMLYWTFRQ